MLVRYLYSSKWVSVRSTTISKVVHSLVGFLCINDTDLIVMNNGKESVEEIVARAKLLVDNWQNTLQLTSRELK